MSLIDKFNNKMKLSQGCTYCDAYWKELEDYWIGLGKELEGIELLCQYCGGKDGHKGYRVQQQDE